MSESGVEVMKSNRTLLVLMGVVELNHDGTDEGYQKAATTAIDNLENAGFDLSHIEDVIEVGETSERS